MDVAVFTVITWIAVVCGLSLLAFVLIVAAPWRWFTPGDSEQRRLDQDIETRLLLGEDPDQLAEELDARTAPRSVAELRPDDWD